MSYTEQIRELFATEIPKEKSKRELLLCGILVNSEVTEENIFASFGTPYAAYAAKDLSKLLRNLSPTVGEKRCGRRTEYSFLCDNRKLASYISELLSCVGAREESAEELRYFVRGAFLACGRITDPDAEAHMEFSLRSEGRADRLFRILSSLGIDESGRTKRRDKFILYYKSRDRISNVLTAMDAGSFVFDYMNRAIYKSVEWDAHRAINMISGNINRSIIAGERQAEACRFLIDDMRGVDLTPELYATAVLRANNVNLTLSELAAVHNPPLTKSGLNNRMKKLLEIAEKKGFKNNT
jgi:DNA-binding protein WhiA